MTARTMHRPPMLAGDEQTAGALARLGLTALRGREGYVVTEALVAMGYARGGRDDLRRRYQAAPASVDRYLQGVDLARLIADAVGDERRLRTAQARATAGTNPAVVAALGVAAGVAIVLALQ